ncbi:MAG: hypothetical protein ACXAC5_17755 [Promethearchaeota archaeon]|jgi:hypothetical protein
MKKLSAIFCVAFCVFWSGADLAGAYPVEFDFTGPFSVGCSLSFTSDDVTVKVTGRSGERNSYVNRTIFGLGVSSWLFDNPQIDGRGPDDLLLLTILGGTAVINSATFRLVGRNDDFRLIVDGNTILDADIPDSRVYDFANPNPLSDRTTITFGFGVTERNDDFTLAAIEVDFIPIPIPGTIFLLGSFLLGIIGVRKKLKK